MRVPSTVKCSSDISPAARSTTRRKKLRATSCVSSRSRFFGKTVGTDRFVHLEAYEPAKQDVVVELLHEQPLAANRIKDLEQLGAEEPLGWNRRAPHRRIQAVEFPRHVAQDLVHEGPNPPERVIARNALFRGHVAEHPIGLLVVSTHSRDGSTGSTACRSPGAPVFQQTPSGL